MNRKDVQKAHYSTQCTVKTIFSVSKQYNSKGLLLRFRCAETHQSTTSSDIILCYQQTFSSF